MSQLSHREAGRRRRHLRVRKKITGTAQRPRLAVHRSSKHMIAQVIDDFSGRTLVNQTTQSKLFREAGTKGSTVEGAKKLGEMIAQAAQGAGIRSVVFDRGGYMYHGRVRAVAEGARLAGLEF